MRISNNMSNSAYSNGVDFNATLPHCQPLEKKPFAMFQENVGIIAQLEVQKPYPIL